MVETVKKDGALKTTKPRAVNGSRFGQWFLALGEVGVLFGIIVLIELLTGDRRVGAFGIHPHPYWLVVIPMAAARGLVAGMTAAGFATVLYAFGARQETAVEDLAVLLSLETMLEPVLFLVVSFLVGEFQDVARERIRRLSTDLGEADAENERVLQQRKVLTKANRILERRLVDQNSHFGNLIEMASRTEKATPGEIREIALELVEEHCGASASILLPRLDGQIELLCHRGWPAGELTACLDASRKSEFVMRAIREGREINGFTSNKPSPESGPLVVCPLIGAPGVIDSLLCLDHVPASILNASTIRTFQAIARWTSALLARSEQGETQVTVAAGPFSRLDPDPRWIGSSEQLGERLTLEYERTVRLGLPLSFLAIRIRGGTDGTSPPMAKVDEFVVERFATRIRCSDAVYRFPRPGCYLLVLPGTPEEGAEALMDRLVPTDREEWQTPGEIEVQVMAPAPGTPDPDSLVAQLGKVFGEAEAPKDGLVSDRESLIEISSSPHMDNLDEFLRSLVGEIGLAMRNEHQLQVVSMKCEVTENVEPGLLALHLLQVAETGLRRVDSIFSIGEGHIALILPKTELQQAEGVIARLRNALAEVENLPPYGEITTEILRFGPQYPYYVPFLKALSAVRPLREVPVAGGYR
jgi:polysaccharide biosynthesis protein PelD